MPEESDKEVPMPEDFDKEDINHEEHEPDGEPEPLTPQEMADVHKESDG